jgi:hypothetical protein
MLRLPVLVPPAIGLKVSEMVQLAPALTLVPQVLVWEKSPLAVMLEMASEALPVLVSVTVCAVLLVPNTWAGKVSEEGAKLTTGPTTKIVSVSVTFMVSFTETDTVVEGGAGGAVLVPAPLRGMVWVKFDPAAVLVRLLKAALSVNVIVPVGVPEDGAT